MSDSNGKTVIGLSPNREFGSNEFKTNQYSSSCLLFGMFKIDENLTKYHHCYSNKLRCRGRNEKKKKNNLFSHLIIPHQSGVC